MQPIWFVNCSTKLKTKQGKTKRAMFESMSVCAGSSSDSSLENGFQRESDPDETLESTPGTDLTNQEGTKQAG